MSENKVGYRGWHFQATSHPVFVRVVGPGDIPPLKCGTMELFGVHDANGKPIKGLTLAFWADEYYDDEEDDNGEETGQAPD
jgi:hypothetical protein